MSYFDRSKLSLA